MNLPTNSIEVTNGTQNGRRDFDQPSRAEGLYPSPAGGGVRSRIQPVGRSEAHQARLASQLSLDTRGGAGQAESYTDSGDSQTDCSLGCPIPDCSICGMLEGWVEFHEEEDGNQVGRPVWQSLDACYADTYEPVFPSPFELAAISVLMPIVGIVHAWRWLYESVRDRKPFGCFVAAVLVSLISATIIVFLHGGAL